MISAARWAWIKAMCDEGAHELVLDRQLRSKAEARELMVGGQSLSRRAHRLLSRYRRRFGVGQKEAA